MTQSELLHRLSERTSIPAPALRAVFHAIVQELVEGLARGEAVSLPGLGRLKMVVQIRTRPCPMTGQCGVRSYPSFRPTKAFKIRVSSRQSHLECLKTRRESRARARVSLSHKSSSDISREPNDEGV